MRLLFSAGAGYSHIAPMLPLAVTARDAGHDVLFVTGPDAVRHCTDAGLDTVGVGATLAGSAGRYTATVTPEQLAGMSADERLAHLVAHYLVGIGAAERLDDMIATVRDFRPTLVISNLAERAAVLAAIVTGVPYVMHAIGPPKTAAVMAEGWRVAADLARPHGVAALPDREPVPYLDIWPDPLRPRDVAWEYPTRWPLRPQNVLPAPPAPKPAVLDGLPHPRTAYVTLGTTHHNRPGALEAMLGGLRGEGVNLVVTIGRDGDPARFGDQPDHVRITGFVPQELLLPHVDAVVCHAGAGTVLGALAHGVPLVVSPLATDQFDMAAQVVAAGVGVLADGPREETVRDGVREVLAGPGYRAAAAGVAAELAALPAPGTVLDRLVRRYS